MNDVTLSLALTLDLIEFLSKYESNDDSPPSSEENRGAALKKRLRSEIETATNFKAFK